MKTPGYKIRNVIADEDVHIQDLLSDLQDRGKLFRLDNLFDGSFDDLKIIHENPKDPDLKVDPETLSEETTKIPVPLSMSEKSMVDLALQKHTLIELQRTTEGKTWEHLEGLINMIDSIQDHLADHGYFKEEIVYPIKGDSE